NCGCEYVYIVQAQAEGSGFSPLFMDEAGAQQRARGSAEAAVNERLREKWDAVPCPQCGWFQEHMVRLRRKRRLILWMLLAVLPLAWVGLKWIFTDAETPAQLGLALWLCVAAVIAIVGIVF